MVNARDAMPRGGKITIEADMRVLDDAHVRSHWPATLGRYAMLAVSETGVGMTEDVRSRIFEPFFTTKEPGKGTGLGLATVYGMVKQNNGFIWVYSEPGQGATFKIYLPLASADATALGKPPAAVARGTETILLAEDAAAVRTAARPSLERFGYTVLEAPSGAGALAIAEKRSVPIHLLLTDVVMPMMSGSELAKRFLALRPEARVLYMSGYTDDAIVRHGVLTEGVRYDS